MRNDERGQMTVELMVVLPAVIIIAIIAVNALTFFGMCAEFDRIARNAVRICATSPAYGQDVGQSVAQVEQMIVEAMDLEGGACAVSASQDALGHTTFDLALTYQPTLFGLGLKSEVFGVALPQLAHSTSLTVDVYKPGMLL